MGGQRRFICARQARPMFRRLRQHQHQDGEKIIITCWVIWAARRKLLHEVEFRSPFATAAVLNGIIADSEVVNLSEPRKMMVTKNSRTLGNGLPINVDTALLKSGHKGAIAVIYRSDDGCLIAVSAVTLQNTRDPDTLEAMACYEGLVLANDCAICRVCLASDCMNVVKKLEEVTR